MNRKKILMRQISFREYNGIAEPLGFRSLTKVNGNNGDAACLITENLFYGNWDHVFGDLRDDISDLNLVAVPEFQSIGKAKGKFREFGQDYFLLLSEKAKEHRKLVVEYGLNDGKDFPDTLDFRVNPRGVIYCARLFVGSAKNLKNYRTIQVRSSNKIYAVSPGGYKRN